ncbi:MAG: NAD-dependent epimerase/dehydratase family protein [Candidatus Cloacimonetes bacterium]|nr:NAD-dependent epimerase/dehydratase family protein [Candidatus Cloacimonadota bacterium]
MLKVAITGANGFVGSNLVKYSLEKGCQVTGLVRHTANLSLLPKNYTATKVDYWDSEQVKSVLHDQDIIVHNAAITRGKNWQQFYQQNVELTNHLVKIFNEIQSLKQFVFISSQAAAGVCTGTAGKREHEECLPVSYYGRSKLLAEEEIMNNCRKNWTIIRPASVFGAGDADFLQYFKLVRSGISFIIGFRPRYISLIHISGLVDMVYRTFDNPQAFNEIFFASCSSFYSWEDFISALEKAMGKKTLRIRIPEFLVYPVALWGEVKGGLSKRAALINLQKVREMKEGNWICDVGKAKESLGFDLESNLTEELRQTYEWYKEQGWL